jgi:TPR repeat protein
MAQWTPVSQVPGISSIHKMKTMLRKARVLVFLCGGLIYFYQEIVRKNPTMDDQENSPPASTASTYWLSGAEKSTLLDKSNKGDKDAAFRLAQYYSFIEFDSAKEQYWLERAATAGHAVAQYNLAFFLFSKENRDTSAALYWAEMAKGNGEKKAQWLIDEIRATSK